MRADQMLALQAGGDAFAVISADPAVLEAVRSDFGGWIEPGISFPGFELKRPARSDGLWTLMDAGGSILARSRRRDPVLRTLLRNLDAIVSTQPTNAIRLGVRAILGPRSVVLADAGILDTEIIVERRWARSGIALVDSPFVDVVIEGPVAHAARSSEPRPRQHDPGHAPASSLGVPVDRLLWRSTNTANEPTAGQIVHAFASNCLTGSPQQRLRYAVELSQRIRVELLPMGSGQPSALSRFEALAGSI